MGQQFEIMIKELQESQKLNKKNSPVMTNERLNEGESLCYENIKDLYSAANILISKGKYKQANILLAFSLEELGKLFLFKEATTYTRSDEWRRFWQLFYCHEDKIKYAFQKAIKKVQELPELKNKKYDWEDTIQKLLHIDKLTSCFTEYLYAKGRFYKPENSAEDIKEYSKLIKLFAELFGLKIDL
jgi:AbiV family abortive infection protein